jgi:N-acetyltransferase 10
MNAFSYEGTGRSLSLKLIKQLRDQAGGVDSGDASLAGRTLREITLAEPIRYATGDPVEAWMNNLLCLDSTVVKPILSGAPHPSQCELFYVNRDTLFSYHKVAETFLQRMMSLYVSSHYKNSPNDLMLMSDAPAHHLFVLLPPIDENTSTLPEILCVVQVRSCSLLSLKTTDKRQDYKLYIQSTI